MSCITSSWLCDPSPSAAGQSPLPYRSQAANIFGTGVDVFPQTQMGRKPNADIGNAYFHNGHWLCHAGSKLRPSMHYANEPRLPPHASAAPPPAKPVCVRARVH
jgi:hypothetical protein